MRKALLVTDAMWVANDVQAALAVDNWDVGLLDDPKLAAEITMHIQPEAVIIDMQVQSMGGMATIRAIRGVFQETPPPRMILLLDRSADRFLARRALADASVLKPVVAHELRAALGPPADPTSADSKAVPGRTRKKAPRRAGAG
jgi:DNA-binding response OmpR family regulator